MSSSLAKSSSSSTAHGHAHDPPGSGRESTRDKERERERGSDREQHRSTASSSSRTHDDQRRSDKDRESSHRKRDRSRSRDRTSSSHRSSGGGGSERERERDSHRDRKEHASSSSSSSRRYESSSSSSKPSLPAGSSTSSSMNRSNSSNSKPSSSSAPSAGRLLPPPSVSLPARPEPPAPSPSRSALPLPSPPNLPSSLPAIPYTAAVPPPPSSYFKPVEASLAFAPRAKKPRLSSAGSATLPTLSMATSSLYQQQIPQKPSTSSTTAFASTSSTTRPAVNGTASHHSSEPSTRAALSFSLQSTASTSTSTSTTISSKPHGSLPGGMSSSSRPPPAEQPAAEPSPPILPVNFYKPPNTRDFRVTYDPATDPKPVKKGKESEMRYDGEGLDEIPTDPRKAKDPETLERVAKVKKQAAVKLKTFSYAWDKNSTGPPPPPPPSAIVVTNFPGSTTVDQILRHFSPFGRIETQDAKTDTKSGGALGILWIKFVDDAPRRPDVDRGVKEKYEAEKKRGVAQDGHEVAKEAVLKGQGAKIGMAMLNRQGEGIKVEIDGDGSKAKKLADAELARRHPTAPPKNKPIASSPPPPPPSSFSASGSSLPSSLPSRPAAGPILPTPTATPQLEKMGPYLAKAYETTQLAYQQNVIKQKPGTSKLPLPASLPPRPNLEASPSAVPRTTVILSSLPPRPSSSLVPPPPSLPPPPPPSLPPPPPPSSLPPPPPPSHPPPPPPPPSIPPPPPPSSIPSKPPPPSAPRAMRAQQAQQDSFRAAQDKSRGVQGLEPYKPIVFSGPPPTSMLARLKNPASSPPSVVGGKKLPGGFAPTPGRSAMSAAVEQAVEAAKKRLKQQQTKKKSRDGEGEADMEMDSDEEERLKKKASRQKKKGKVQDNDKENGGGSGDDEDDGEDDEEEEEEEDEAKDRVFFHGSQSQTPNQKFVGRNGHAILMRGQAPAAAIAWQASKAVLLEKLADNGNRYISIERGVYNPPRTVKGKAPVLNGGELELHFVKFDLDRTFADRDGWYITFNDPDSAAEAYAELHDQPFAGAPLVLKLSEPVALPKPSSPPRPRAPVIIPAPPSASRTSSNRVDISAALQKIKTLAGPREPEKERPAAPMRRVTWTDAQLIQEARDIVVRDLMASFKTDVKNRVVSGKVWEHIQAWEQAGSATSAPPSPSKSQSPVKQESVDTALEPPSQPQPANPLSLKSLPSFARRRPAVNNDPATSSSHKKALAARRFSSEAPSQSPDVDVEPPPSFASLTAAVINEDKKKEKKAASKKKARIQSDSDEGSVDVPLVSRHGKAVASPEKKKKAKVVNMDYTSSEGEDDVEEPPQLPTRQPSPPLDSLSVVVPQAPLPPALPTPMELDDVEIVPQPQPEEPIVNVTPVVAPLPAKKKKGGKKQAKADLSLPILIPPVPLDEDAVMLDEIVGIPTPAPTDTTASTNKRDLSNIDSDRDGDSDAVKPKSKAARARKLAASKAAAGARGVDPDPFEAGVAADEEDLFYLKLAIQRPRMGSSLHPTPPPSEDENEAPPRHASGSARTEGYYAVTVAERMANRPSSNKAKAAIESAAGTSGVAVSRLARANTRGLVRGMELHKKVTATDTDVLKFNQLRTRKKQLTFARSGIEGYGLFAMEHIPAGEMVIEYVGELIRQQVADRREKAYERQGIGSSYLFRVDEDLVVDATKKGNLGRLINHCCAPNCTARIITINGEKKIVIYAKANIEPGDEVTYDYHFPHEEVKIPCLCAHPLCRKYLN